MRSSTMCCMYNITGLNFLQVQCRQLQLLCVHDSIAHSDLEDSFLCSPYSSTSSICTSFLQCSRIHRGAYRYLYKFKYKIQIFRWNLIAYPFSKTPVVDGFAQSPYHDLFSCSYRARFGLFIPVNQDHPQSSNTAVVLVGKYYPESWYCSMQGPRLDKIIDLLSPVSCRALSSTVKAIQQEKNFQLNFSLLYLSEIQEFVTVFNKQEN